MDSWSDARFSGKHTYVEDFVKVHTITATGFTNAIGYMIYLPVANIVYAYDLLDGTNIILDHNSPI